MSYIKIECCKCDECEHIWIPSSLDPERCPSRKCRTVNWHHPEDKPAKPKVVKRAVEKLEPEVGRTEQVKESLPEKARVLIVSSPRCPACRTPLVPFGTSKRCDNCKRNF